jgi:hypothetical protein
MSSHFWDLWVRSILSTGYVNQVDDWKFSPPSACG